MNPAAPFFFVPGRQRVLRTLFWLLCVLTIAFTAYGVAVEFFGLGLFLPRHDVPKRHMTGEAELAAVLSSMSAIGLTVT